MTLSINRYDSEGIVSSYREIGEIIVFILFGVHFILFFINLFMKYPRKINNRLPNFIFVFYAGFTFTTIYLNEITITISTIAFYSAIYALIIFINYLVYIVIKNKISKLGKTNLARGRLPIGWLSQKDFLTIKIVFLLIVVTILLLLIFDRKILYIVILISGYLILFLILLLKQKIILNNILKSYFFTIDINELISKFEKLKLEILHPKTLSKLNLIKICLMLFHDFDKAEKLLKQSDIKERFFDQLTYQFTLIDYCFLLENYSECIKIIDDILLNKRLNKLVSNSLLNYKMRIEMNIKRQPDSNILKVYRIDTSSPYHNLINSLIYEEYYYYNGNNDKALKYLNDIMASEADLLTLKRRATNILDKDNEIDY